jgi:2,3-bisphosphoglycerate-dependent phosphoglycerate mutase
MEYRQTRFKLPPGGTHIFIVRHGESKPLRVDEPQPLVDGHGDPPLDPRGHAQATKVAARLVGQPITAIYVTTLQRTVQTAAPLAEATGLTPIVEPDLREIHLGEWEGGVYRIRREENHPDWQRVLSEKTWDVIPGAEQEVDLARRIVGAIGRISKGHPDERVVVFTHGGVIGMISALATGGRMHQLSESDNGSLTHLVVSGDEWMLRRFNDTSHLDPDLDLD